jgi:hypothetical protein
MVPVEVAVNSSIEPCCRPGLADVVRNLARIGQHQRLVMQRNKQRVQMHNFTQVRAILLQSR